MPANNASTSTCQLSPHASCRGFIEQEASVPRPIIDTGLCTCKVRSSYAPGAQGVCVRCILHGRPRAPHQRLIPTCHGPLWDFCGPNPAIMCDTASPVPPGRTVQSIRPHQHRVIQSPVWTKHYRPISPILACICCAVTLSKPAEISRYLNVQTRFGSRRKSRHIDLWVYQKERPMSVANRALVSSPGATGRPSDSRARDLLERSKPSPPRFPLPLLLPATVNPSPSS